MMTLSMAGLLALSSTGARRLGLGMMTLSMAGLLAFSRAGLLALSMAGLLALSRAGMLAFSMACLLTLRMNRNRMKCGRPCWISACIPFCRSAP